MRIDFFGLQAFVSIAERGSFQRAAAHLNLSQTALSHRIRKFEDSFGVTLMTRTTRQITLTPAGLDLLPKARRIMAEAEQSLRDLREYGTTRRMLTLGCLPTMASHYLPALLQTFRTSHPDLAIRVFDNSAAEIAVLIEQGTAEFGITLLSTNRSDMEVRPLMKESFVLVMPGTHELAARPAVDWSELAGTPLVRIGTQAGNRLLIDDALASRWESLRWQYEVQHVSTAISMVAAGNGLTIVPRLAFHARATSGLEARPLCNPEVSRTIGFMFKRYGQLSAEARELVALIEADHRHGGLPAGKHRQGR